MPTALGSNHHQTLVDELTHLRTEARAAAAERLRAARAAAGGGRDADVAAAEAARVELEHRIARLEHAVRTLDRAPAAHAEEAAGLGSRVLLRREGSSKPRSYTLVSPAAGDTKAGLLPVDTPLGRALVGRRAGDRVRVEAPAGAFVALIEEVAGS